MTSLSSCPRCGKKLDESHGKLSPLCPGVTGVGELSLEDMARKLRGMLSDGATGPLVAASEIVRIADRWDTPPITPTNTNSATALKMAPGTLREQAGGGTCDQWVRSRIAAGGLRYFVERHKAVQRLGEACRRTMHHEAAVYIANNVSDAKLDEVKLAVMRKAKEHGLPVSLSQGKRIAAAVMGPRRKKVTDDEQGAEPCRRCAVLEEFIRWKGLEVPEPEDEPRGDE